MVFHTTGNNNPTGVEVRRSSKVEAEKDTLPFFPYFVIKDLVALGIILAIFAAIVGFIPNYLGHPDNYIEVDPLVHQHTSFQNGIFYHFMQFCEHSLLTCGLFIHFITGGIIDAKFFGVLAMFGAIAVMGLAPWLDTSTVRSEDIDLNSSGGSRY